MVHELALKHHRGKRYVTTGWVEDAYPDERGWIDQPGNSDRKRRVFYAREQATTKARRRFLIHHHRRHAGH